MKHKDERAAQTRAEPSDDIASAKVGYDRQRRRLAAEALPPPNWDLWAHMPTVELWQAVALSMPMEPETVSWDRNGWMAGGSDVLAIDDAATFPNAEAAKLFRDRYRLLQACYWHPPFTRPIGASPLHRSPVKLLEFVTWASSQRLFDPVPEPLRALMARSAPARPGGSAKWDKWRLMPRVPLWKAVCLSFDLEPREDMHAQMLRTRGRFGPGTPNFQDRLEILQANLDLGGPIRPQGALYAGMLQNPSCEVSLSEVAAFLLGNGVEVPAEMAALVSALESDAAPGQETKEQREDRRLKMCEDAGLTMPKSALARMPDGIGKIADTEGVSRQAFTEDVKNALKRKLERQREGSGSR